MGTIIRQRPVAPSARAEGVTLEQEGGAVLVRSGGYPGVTLEFEPRSILGTDDVFDAIDGALIVRTFERIIVRFPEAVPQLDLELELFPCGIVSLRPEAPRGDPPARVRFPVIEYTAAELVGASQPAIVLDLGQAPAELGASLAKPYYLPDQYLGGFVVADQTCVLDVFAYRDTTWDPATALYIGGWSVIDNTVTGRAELCLEEGGMTRSNDGIRMGGPVVIPPFGLFLRLRTTGLTDLTNVYARFWTRSR